MKTLFKVLSLTLVLMCASFTLAEGYLSRVNLITLKLEMGSNAQGMCFLPNELNLTTDQATEIEVDPHE